MGHIRRAPAVLSACGFAGSLVIYAASYGGLTLDRMGWWPFVFTLGAVILYVPICLIENPSMSQAIFFWKEFRQGKPPWVYRTICYLAVFFIIHFVLFGIMSHFASPEILKGSYVLDDHGDIRKVLTQREYLSLKDDELRIFPTG
jgi:hypothetical protein